MNNKFKMQLRKKLKQRPLIIAHRGYSSLLPENTLESIEAAIYKSDLVQFDILLTKDKQVVIFHDRYLSRLTDVENHQQFKNKKRIAEYDVEENQTMRDDWWLQDFTLQELNVLQVRQAFENRPQFKGLCFKIPTLESAIREILNIKKKSLVSNNCGFLIEIKSLWQHKDDGWDEVIVKKLVQILKANGLQTQQKCSQQRLPIMIQSFNNKILDLVSKSQLKLPIIHLFDQKQTIHRDYLSQKTVPKMIGIGISQAHGNSQIKQICQQQNLLLFYWTLRDDSTNKLPFKKSSYKEVYLYLLQLGVNGLITQFPEKCEQYINEYYRLKRQ